MKPMGKLKKVLALGLAYASAFTMYSSAVTFTDREQIVTGEAVDTLVALGVINGYQDGSFKPEGAVTRAEMAKMIYIVRTGKSDASAYNEDYTTFTDIEGHWARGYIKYAQAMGIIAGKSATIFDPNANVTTQEAAKMLLVALGYNPEIAGLEGANWGLKTNALADENGLLKDINVGTTQAAPRQYAAQMIYNAVMANTVTYRDGAYTNLTPEGKDLDTLGEKYMGLKRWIGTYDSTSMTTGGREGEIQVRGKLSTADANANKTTASFPYTLSLDYIGEEVTVLFKDNELGTKEKPDYRDSIYGVFVNGNTTVARGILDDVDGLVNNNGTSKADKQNKIKLGNTEYELAKLGENGVTELQIITNFGAAATQSFSINATNTTSDAVHLAFKNAFNNLTKQNGSKVKLVLNDDNKVQSVYVTNESIGKITAVTNTKVTLQTKDNTTVTLTLGDAKKHEVYEGIARDDVVTYTKLYNNQNAEATFVVTKAETVTGTLSGYNTKNGKTDKVTVAGTSYKVHMSTDQTQTLNGLWGDATDNAIETVGDGHIGKEVTAYLVNGYVAAIDSSAVNNNYAYIMATNGNDSLDGTFNTFEMKVKLADGTEQVVAINKDSRDKASNKWTADDFRNSFMVKYDSINAKGEMDVTAVYYKTDAGNAADSNKTDAGKAYSASYTATAETKVYDKTSKTVLGVDRDTATRRSTTSDTVVFVYNQQLDKTYNFQLRSLSDVSVKAGSLVEYSYALDTNGYVAALYITLDSRPSSVGASKYYGIITTDGETVKVDGDTYHQYTVANNEGNQTIYVEGTGVADKLKKGKVIYFDMTTDNLYNVGDVTVAAEDTANAKAIYIDKYESAEKLLRYGTSVTYNETKRIFEIDSLTSSALTADAKIVYVDQDNNVGGQEIGIYKFDPDTGRRNAFIIFESAAADAKIEAVIIESSGEQDVIEAADPVKTNAGGGGTGTVVTTGYAYVIDQVAETDTVYTVRIKLDSGTEKNVEIPKTTATAAQLTNALVKYSDANGTVAVTEVYGNDANKVSYKATAETIVFNATNDTVLNKAGTGTFATTADTVVFVKTATGVTNSKASELTADITVANGAQVEYSYVLDTAGNVVALYVNQA